MNKSCSLFLLVLLLALTAQAQEFKNYGIISNEESALKICSFDKDADAVFLLDEATSNYNEDHNLITNHHIRIKILKEKGIELANVSIPFRRKDDIEYLKDIEGETFNDNGTGAYTDRAAVDKRSIFTKKTDEFYGEIKFTFPAVKVGSILEYKYRSIIKNYGYLEDWYFQKELPVLHSRYNLEIIPNTEFTYRVQKRPDLQVIVKPNSNDGSVYFEMSEIPGLRQEAYMDASADYLQKIIFQLSAYNNGYGQSKYMTSWNEAARELRTSSSFGNQLEKSLSGTESLLGQVKTLSSPFEKMRTVFAFIQNNMNWNHYSGIYSPESVKDAWSKKTGNSGDINLILINLLKQAGLTVNPVLISKRSHGKVSPLYPFIGQFNFVFAAVDIGAKRYFLDATDKITPAHIIPYDILNTTGFLITKKEGTLIAIANDSLQYEDINTVNLTVGSNGIARGKINTKNVDYSKVENLRQYFHDKTKYQENHFRNLVSGLSISDYDIKNIEEDSLPLSQQCNFTLPLSGSGDYKFIPLNFMPGFGENPFVGDNRFSNINFGYRQSISLKVYVNLPDNYSVDALPTSVKLSNPDGDMVFTRKVFYQKDVKQLVCMLSVEIKKSLYLPENYIEIKEFYKKLFSYLNEQVVLKKI